MGDILFSGREDSSFINCAKVIGTLPFVVILLFGILVIVFVEFVELVDLVDLGDSPFNDSREFILLIK